MADSREACMSERSLELEQRANRQGKELKQYSLEDLVGLAGDAGISEASVRAAVASERSESLSYSAFFGGPTVLESRSIARRTGEADLQGIVTELPAITKVKGRGFVDGGSLHWEFDPAEALKGMRLYSISATVRNDDIELVISNRLSNAAGGLFGGNMGFFGLAAGLGFGLPLLPVSPLFIALFAIAAVVPAYYFSKDIYRRIVAKERVRMTEILDVIIEMRRPALRAEKT